jgi:hypothetical protein
MITGLNKGERVALLLFLTKDSGVFRNLNTSGGMTPVARAAAEVARLRGTAAGVTGLDQLFTSSGTVAAPTVVATALGFSSDDFYDPSGPCPPAGDGDEAIYEALSENL